MSELITRLRVSIVNVDWTLFSVVISVLLVALISQDQCFHLLCYSLVSCLSNVHSVYNAVCVESSLGFLVRKS